jgi:hypothetical protein
MIDCLDSLLQPVQFFLRPRDGRTPVFRLRSLDHALDLSNGAFDLPQALPFI